MSKQVWQQNFSIGTLWPEWLCLSQKGDSPISLVPGEDIKVNVEISNRTSRSVKPKFILYEKKSFFAQGRRRVSTNDIIKEKMKVIEPSSKEATTKVITIPRELPSSILNCSIIKLEYRLKVNCSFDERRDFVLKFRIRIFKFLTYCGYHYLDWEQVFSFIQFFFWRTQVLSKVLLTYLLFVRKFSVIWVWWDDYMHWNCLQFVCACCILPEFSKIMKTGKNRLLLLLLLLLKQDSLHLLIWAQQSIYCIYKPAKFSISLDGLWRQPTNAEIVVTVNKSNHTTCPRVFHRSNWTSNVPQIPSSNCR